MLLVFSGRTQWRMSTLHLTTFISGLPVCVAPIVGAPFFFQSHLQIPQSHFCAIPATCFVKDAAHVMLDYFFVCVGLCCDLCIGASLENQRCDSPLLTGKVCVSKQQRHDFHSISKRQSCHLCTSFAIWLKPDKHTRFFLVGSFSGPTPGGEPSHCIPSGVDQPFPAVSSAPSTTVQPQNSTM